MPPPSPFPSPPPPSPPPRPSAPHPLPPPALPPVAPGVQTRVEHVVELLVAQPGDVSDYAFNVPVRVLIVNAFARDAGVPAVTVTLTITAGSVNFLFSIAAGGNATQAAQTAAAVRQRLAAAFASNTSTVASWCAGCNGPPAVTQRVATVVLSPPAEPPSSPAQPAVPPPSPLSPPPSPLGEVSGTQSSAQSAASGGDSTGGMVGGIVGVLACCCLGLLLRHAWVSRQYYRKASKVARGAVEVERTSVVRVDDAYPSATATDAAAAPAVAFLVQDLEGKLVIEEEDEAMAPSAHDARTASGQSVAFTASALDDIPVVADRSSLPPAPTVSPAPASPQPDSCMTTDAAAGAPQPAPVPVPVPVGLYTPQRAWVGTAEDGAWTAPSSAGDDAWTGAGGDALTAPQAADAGAGASSRDLSGSVGEAPPSADEVLDVSMGTPSSGVQDDGTAEQPAGVTRVEALAILATAVEAASSMPSAAEAASQAPAGCSFDVPPDAASANEASPAALSPRDLLRDLLQRRTERRAAPAVEPPSVRSVALSLSLSSGQLTQRRASLAERLSSLEERGLYTRRSSAAGRRSAQAVPMPVTALGTSSVAVAVEGDGSPGRRTDSLVQAMRTMAARGASERSDQPGGTGTAREPSSGDLTLIQKRASLAERLATLPSSKERLERARKEHQERVDISEEQVMRV